MPKAKRAISVSPATPAATATAKRGKRVTSAAAAVPAVAAVDTAAVAIVTAAAVPAVDTAPRGLTRDAAGIVRYATNYAVYSDRDSAYLAFFGNVLRAGNGSASLRDIHAAGITRSGHADRKRFNPNYSGSAKATDVGAVNRLCKAGYFTRSADGNVLTATALALASKAYLGT